MQINVTTIQTNLFWENKDANYKLLSEELQKSASNSNMIILPEMFTTGFSMDTENLAESMSGPSIKWMKSFAKKSNKHIVGSLIIKEKDFFFNRLIVSSPNEAISFYDKKHLFSYADEHLNYSPGKKELIINIKGVKIAFFICYDLRFPVWCRNTNLKYDIAIFIANWPKKRREHWTNLLKARAIENQSFVIGVNRVGNDGNGITYSGDSAVYNYLGEKISLTLPNEQKVENISLNIDALNEFRVEFPTHLDADNFKIT